jgi:hypothetical protein
MENKLDLTTLLEFIEWSGADFYFKNVPFITDRHQLAINRIDRVKLIKWVEDFNNKRGLISNSDNVEDPIR